MKRNPKKRGPGRPSLGALARNRIVTIKVTQDEYDEWRERAADRPLAEWIRARCGHVDRIEVSPDDGDWHWVAYAGERTLSTAGIESGPDLEARVRRAAIEHGLVGVEDADVQIETPV